MFHFFYETSSSSVLLGKKTTFLNDYTKYQIKKTDFGSINSIK